MRLVFVVYLFFFQAEDGIRDDLVTGVQTCALPISGFRALFLATLASSIGTWLAFIALVVDVFDRTGDASWVSALLIAEFFPLVVVGILAGRLIDRTSRRWLLVSADLF